MHKLWNIGLGSQWGYHVLRLYVKHQTDLSHKGHRAHEEVSATILWGSAYNSRLAAKITVKWLKGREEPIVWIEKGQGVKSE